MPRRTAQPEAETEAAGSEPTEDAAAPDPVVEQAGLDPEKGTIITLKKNLKRKGGPSRQGDELAVVFLADGVTINQLSDAIRASHVKIIEPKRNGVAVD